MVREDNKHIIELPVNEMGRRKVSESENRLEHDPHPACYFPSDFLEPQTHSLNPEEMRHKTVIKHNQISPLWALRKFTCRGLNHSANKSFAF